MNLEYQQIKEQLLAKCHQMLDQRIETAKSAMENAQKAANEEGKSSAGDKYETTRAMMQIERDNAAKQLDSAMQTKNALSQIDIISKSATIKAGSLVYTSKDNYFLAASIGQLSIGNSNYLAISPISPIGQQLLGKKKDDIIQFNNQKIVVTEVY